MNRILLVDDDHLIGETIVEILEMHEYSTLWVASAEEALETCLVFKPDLIISDINLPDMSGEDLRKRLSEMRETKDIPFVFLTGDVSVKHRLSGQVDVFIKPFAVKELVAKIAKYF